MSLFSKFAIPNPNDRAWGRSGREAAAATPLLKRLRPSACGGLAEGSLEVGLGQDRRAWGKLYNYYYIIIVMNSHSRSAWGPPAVLLLRT
jgi:hypothetical protein